MNVPALLKGPVLLIAVALAKDRSTVPRLFQPRSLRVAEPVMLVAPPVMSGAPPPTLPPDQSKLPFTAMPPAPFSIPPESINPPLKRASPTSSRLPADTATASKADRAPAISPGVETLTVGLALPRSMMTTWSARGATPSVQLVGSLQSPLASVAQRFITVVVRKLYVVDVASGA